MDKIIPAFETTLFDPSLHSVLQEMTELGIDSLLDNGILRDVPIVNLIIGLGKTAQNIQDRNLLRNTIMFIKTFNDKNLSQAKIDKYRNKLQNKPKFAEEELGRVIVLLNSYTELKKSELLAKLYFSYINGIIDWPQFCELSDITSRLFIADLQLLYNLYSDKTYDTSQCPLYKIQRLRSLGLVDSEMEQTVENSTLLIHRNILINELGNLFCSITLN